MVSISLISAEPNEHPVIGSSYLMNLPLGILIGGLAPAFVFGLGAIFQKQSNEIGVGQGAY